MDARIPPPLQDQALKLRHVLFLLIVIYTVTAMLGVAWGRSIDPAIRFAWDNLVIHGMAAICVTLFALAVPQLRRALPFLYSRPRVPMDARDAAVFIAVMLAWAYGAHRFFIVFPLLKWYPPFVTVLTADQAPGPTFIFLWSVTAGVLSPFAEELIFRGFLQNLWQRRWGTLAGVLLSAGAFGAIHLQSAVFAMVAGIFLSLVYLKYGSLWPGTLLHALYNLVAAPSLLAPLFAKPIDHLGSVSEWIPELVITVLFFPLLFLFWRRFRPT